jgi:uncharacterized protein YbjT (DUF2867 family)
MILITGAGGNVGAEVLRQIAKTGHRVRAAFQSASKIATAPTGIETVTMDYNQPKTIRAALRNVDRVFLVAPVSPSLVQMERKATDEMKRAGVHWIVKLSAMGSRDATFPRQHAESEDYIKSSGVSYTFLQSNGFMQNLFIYNGATIRGQNTFYGSQAEGKVSHIDVRDIAAVAVKALTEDLHIGKTYTLTGPEALGNARIAEILSESTGRQIRYVDLAPEDMRKALLASGSSEWSANAILDLNQLYRNNGASMVSGDAERILGRKPTRFEQFVRDYAGSFEIEKGAAQGG